MPRRRTTHPRVKNNRTELCANICAKWAVKSYYAERNDQRRELETIGNATSCTKSRIILPKCKADLFDASGGQTQHCYLTPSGKNGWISRSIRAGLVTRATFAFLHLIKSFCTARFISRRKGIVINEGNYLSEFNRVENNNSNTAYSISVIAKFLEYPI